MLLIELNYYWTLNSPLKRKGLTNGVQITLSVNKSTLGFDIHEYQCVRVSETTLAWKTSLNMHIS